VTARGEILPRIAAALGHGVAVPDVPRAYRLAQSGPPAGDEAVVARFCERAAEYRATVRRVAAGELEDAITEACREHGAQRVATPPGMPHRAPGVELLIDEPPIPARGLDGVDGVLVPPEDPRALADALHKLPLAPPTGGALVRHSPRDVAAAHQAAYERLSTLT